MKNSYNERFGFCDDCLNRGMCYRCYRGSCYEPKEDEQ